MSFQIEIIFGIGEGQITLQGVDQRTIVINDNLPDRGPTASFNAKIPKGGPMPEIGSLCVIRQIIGSGFAHEFTGRYEKKAVELPVVGPWTHQFAINNLIDYTHRDEIEAYSNTTTLRNHIRAALIESGVLIEGEALSLLDVQSPIPGDDGEPFFFEFEVGNLELFLEQLCSLKKAKWKIEPLPWVDYLAKVSGPYALIEIFIDGTTANRNVPGKIDHLNEHCDDPDYIKLLDTPIEPEDLPIASRFVINGRNGRKQTEEEFDHEIP